MQPNGKRQTEESRQGPLETANLFTPVFGMRGEWFPRSIDRGPIAKLLRRLFSGSSGSQVSFRGRSTAPTQLTPSSGNYNSARTRICFAVDRPWPN